MIARDAPGMADIDSSFLLFVKKSKDIIKLFYRVNVLMKSLVAIHGFIKRSSIV